MQSSVWMQKHIFCSLWNISSSRIFARHPLLVSVKKAEHLVNHIHIRSGTRHLALSADRCLNQKSFRRRRRNSDKRHIHRPLQDSLGGNDDTPVIVKMLAKKGNYRLTLNEDENISVEDLQKSLKDISWDLQAAVNKSLLQEHETEKDYELDHFEPIHFSTAGDEKYVESIQLDESSSPAVKRKQKVVGKPDKSIPKSDIPCSGCGAVLHCQDSFLPGYMPSEKFRTLARDEMMTSVCQRCHLMTFHNLCLKVSVSSDEYPKIISKIRHTKCLVVVVADLTDLSNSFFKNLPRYIGHNKPLFVVGNKVDLMPKDKTGYLNRLKEALISACEEAELSPLGRNIRHVCLVSAKTGYGIEELITKLMSDWKLQGDVFLLGNTNVGKSSLFNALLHSDYCKSHVRDIIHKATVSVWPGTTLNLLKFPIINPAPWRIYLRTKRLMKKREADVEEKRLSQRRKTAEEERPHPALLKGDIGQTDFRSVNTLAELEEESEYMGQEVVAYEFSESGQLSEQSGKHLVNLPKNQKPNVSFLEVLRDSRWTFDTPGVINPEQVINLLTPEELAVVLPRKMIYPRVFVVKPSQVIFISGLGRIDYCQGDKSIFFTVHCASDIPVHVVDGETADSLYRRWIGTPKLKVPKGDNDRLMQLPSLIGREFCFSGIGFDQAAADIQLSSLGWVSVMAGLNMDVIIRAYTPGGYGCRFRSPALLPNILAFRGQRKKGTAMYNLKKPKL